MRLRSYIAIITAILLAIAIPNIIAGSARGDVSTNFVQNPSLENLDASGFPACFEKSGWGSNTPSWIVVHPGHTGNNAMQLTLASRTTGDRKLLETETPACAPPVMAGKSYTLSAWYKSTVSAAFTVFTHTSSGWSYWKDLKNLLASGAYSQVSVLTPPIPAGVDQISFGLSIAQAGSVTTDDYSATTAVCGACTSGQWQVLSYPDTVRSVHSILLHNGKVLFMAGSGNDPMQFNAGTFKSTVYDPVSGTFTDIATPEDLFCSGHLQLPDGNVLIMGGTKAYPAADGSHTYEGLKSSYIFNVAANSYQRINDLNTGHWYPSATELGNGDVLTFGGLDENGNGNVTTEYFSTAQGKWLPTAQVNQTYSFWGLYPSMTLMGDGRLFYSGSHVFGNGLPGTGSSILDYNANTITSVPGLRNVDQRDQSMTVLLPPAQSQKAMIMGGGNIVTNVNAVNTTDMIDLSQAAPSYSPGPDMLPGTMDNGAMEPAGSGKMYMSTVIMPNRKVFETGGSLHNRSDNVHEASVYDPVTNAFTAMPPDPVGRDYHSEAILLPDGRILSVGSNPGDGTFEMRISVYSPAYLFQGTKPSVTSATQEWAYGSLQSLTVTSATGTTIKSAALIRPSAMTHSSDPNQRLVDLPLTGSGGNLTAMVTANHNIAPPGWYMLTVTDSNGVPSPATWVHLSPPAGTTRSHPLAAPVSHMVMPRKAVTVPRNPGGCDHHYGRVNQCVPVTFPAGGSQGCTWLLAHGFGILAVHDTDDKHLDGNHDGLACNGKE